MKVIFFVMQQNRLDVVCCLFAPTKDKPVSDGVLYNIFKSGYVPALMRKWTRVSVIIVFFAWLCISLSVIPDIEIGLDQELSMAVDSYVYKYFKVSSLTSNFIMFFIKVLYISCNWRHTSTDPRVFFKTIPYRSCENYVP